MSRSECCECVQHTSLNWYICHMQSSSQFPALGKLRRTTQRKSELHAAGNTKQIRILILSNIWIAEIVGLIFELNVAKRCEVFRKVYDHPADECLQITRRQPVSHHDFITQLDGNGAHQMFSLFVQKGERVLRSIVFKRCSSTHRTRPYLCA